MRFESADFKLSHEMTQLLDPSGAMKSDSWARFVRSAWQDARPACASYFASQVEAVVIRCQAITKPLVASANPGS